MNAVKVTIHTLQKRKRAGEKITMLTCYDAAFARLLESTGVDVLLVGDSLGMVVQGHETTLPVTLEDVIYHTRAVARVARRAQLVGDLPFLSYQASIEDGIRSAGRLVKEGGAEAVKLEGGARHADLVRRLVEIGVPVMGHVGLTPQSYHQLGGFKVQGKGDEAARRLLDDAIALEQAGAYSIVLESIPLDVAARITAAVSVPTIGIGAGPHCDGQVLVLHDLLGLIDDFKPRFVRRYESLGVRVRTAVDAFVHDVRLGAFPSEEESFGAGPSPGTKPVPAPASAPAPAPARRPALAALAFTGACAAPDDPATVDDEPSDEGLAYGAPRATGRRGRGGE